MAAVGRQEEPQNFTSSLRRAKKGENPHQSRTAVVAQSSPLGPPGRCPHIIESAASVGKLRAISTTTPESELHCKLQSSSFEIEKNGSALGRVYFRGL